ncbi:MAG: aminopeptidase P family protein [Chloroflexi bacterium]|nr:aminopeptidase P family protein [Chloroflexota bacterium]
MSVLMDLDRCHKLMDESGVDALLVSSPVNFGYVTGFFYGNNVASHRPIGYEYDHVPVVGQMEKSLSGGYAVVPGGTSTEAFVVAHRYVVGHLQGQERSWIKDIRPYGSAFLKQTFPANWMKDDPIDLLAGGLVEKGLARARIGIDGHAFPAIPFGELRKKLPEADFVDAESLLWRLREVKSAEEIRRMRKAADATVKGVQAALAAAEEGMTEIQFTNIIHREYIEQGADRAWQEVMFGPDKERAWESGGHTATERRLRRGDFCLIDAGGCYRMYQADCCRYFWFGREPTDEEKRTYQSILDAVDAAYEVMRPGVKCSEVYRVVEDILGRLGWTPGGVGHGVGLMVHEPPCFSDFSDETLEEGMVMALEIAVAPVVPGKPRVCPQYEDEVLITKDSAEQLTPLPRWIVI